MDHKLLLIPLKKRCIYKFKDLVSKCIPPTKQIFLFDIDNTLYCESTGLSEYIKSKIYEYAEYKKIPKHEIQEVCMRYSKEYGLAIKGFLREHPGTDPAEFDRLVDGCVTLEQYIRKDDELKQLIGKLKGGKFCFTNANYKHAVGVLNAMGLVDVFDGVFYCEYDFEGRFVCKPDEEAYSVVEDVTGGGHFYFYDDSLRNVEEAEKRGWICELISIENNIKLVLKKQIAEFENGEKMMENAVVEAEKKKKMENIMELKKIEERFKNNKTDEEENLLPVEDKVLNEKKEL